MKSHLISFSNGRIHCAIFGNGPSIIIAFHGFGQDGLVFQKTIGQLPGHRIYALDLPFHGKSVLFDDSKPVMPHQVIEIIENLTKTQKINRFSVVAFSIGTRFVWPVIETYTDRIDEITLIAPVSLPENVWYRLAVQNRVSRSLFKYLTNSKKALVDIFNMAQTVKVIQPALSKYLIRIVEQDSLRLQIYNTWTSMRLLKPDFAQLISAMKGGMRLQIVVGEYDSLINHKKVIARTNALPGVIITKIPCRHHELIEKFVNLMAKKP